MEEVVQEKKTLEAMSSQKQIPRRRGKPRKNKEARETQVPNKPHAKSVAKELLMHAIQLEPVEGTSRGIGSGTKRIDVVVTNVRE
jgi:hypothetical protein